VRFLIPTLLALAACDFQPPAPAPTKPAAAKAPEPAPPAPAEPVPAPPTPAAGSDAARLPDGKLSAQAQGELAQAAKAPTDVTPECMDAGSHIAAVIVTGAPDTQRAALEQDRAMLVRRSAEACTRDHWPAQTLACFASAQTMEALQVCGRDLAAP
jgi:hypothetical protein